MRKHSSLVLATVVILSVGILAACGSTKVYTAEKTMTYNGSIYTLNGVSKITSKVEGTTPDGETIDLGSVDKAQFKALKEKSGSLEVTTAMVLGDEEVTVETGTVDKYSDLEKMIKNLDKKLQKITKFMKDAKKTQLELK